MPEAISLKFGMWSTEVGGNVHSKICLVSSRQHRATEVRKLRFVSSCQYTHGCCAPASWAARHTTVCLDSIGWVKPSPKVSSDRPETFASSCYRIFFLIIQQNFLLPACPPACLTPSVKRSGKVATATALIFSQKRF